MKKTQVLNKKLGSKRSKRLFQAILSLKTEDECAAFMGDLCTMAELQAMAERFNAAELVSNGDSYRVIANKINTSTTTVTRVAHWYQHGLGGYPLVISRLQKH